MSRQVPVPDAEFLKTRLVLFVICNNRPPSKNTFSLSLNMFQKEFLPLSCCSVVTTVPSKVRNLRKMRNFGQNFAFFCKFVSCNGGFWPNLNQSLQNFGAKQTFHPLETQLKGKK